MLNARRKAVGEDDRNYYSGRLVRCLGLHCVARLNLTVTSSILMAVRFIFLLIPL